MPISHKRMYRSSDLDEIKRLVSTHDFCSGKILEFIRDYSQNIMLEIEHGDIVSIFAHDAEIGKCWCSVYFFTLKDVLHFFDESLSELNRMYGLREVIVCLEKSDPMCEKLQGNANFKIKAKTYAYELENSHLVRRSLPGNVKFETYNDDVYDEYQRLINRSFKEVADKLGCDLLSYTSRSEFKRKYFLKNAKDFFYVEKDDKIVATAYAGGGLIDYLAVDNKYRHRGIIRDFVLFAINKFIDENRSLAKLELDECNFKAVGFYESLGFEVKDKVVYFFFSKI